MKSFYKKVFIISLYFTYVYANSCENPAVASDDLNTQFRYGCFCGKNYPTIEHPSKKAYKELNTTQRQELINIQTYSSLTL